MGLTSASATESELIIEGGIKLKMISRRKLELELK